MSPQRTGNAIWKTSFFSWGSSNRIAPSDAEAVVGGDHRAVDEMTFGAREQHDERIEVLGRAHAFARQHVDQLLATLGFPLVVVDLGVDVAGADRVDVDL